MKRVSLLYTHAGGGHLSLSLATREALDRYYRGKYECVLFDPFPSFYSGVYKQLSTQLQTIWKLGYQATDLASLSQPITYLNRLPLASHLREHIRSFKPDIVVSNNAFISTVLPSVLEKLPRPPKRVVHFADPFSLHHLWLADKTADLYLSPTPEVTAFATQNGVSASRIKTVGWLTRQKFLSGPMQSAGIRPVLGLEPDKFTLFIGGAGQGVEKISSLLNQLVRSSVIRSRCQIIVNTGLNPQLAAKVIRLSEKYSDLFHIVPYAHNMPYLLSASDITIGKAGPNFLFESVQQLRPILAIGCLPGQEEGNLEFIQTQHLGWVEQEFSSLVYLVEQLAQNPKLTKEKLPYLKKIKSRHVDTPRRLAWEINRLK